LNNNNPKKIMLTSRNISKASLTRRRSGTKRV